MMPQFEKWYLFLALIAVRHSVAEDSLEQSPSVSWLLAEDGLSNCFTVCQGCGGECIDDDKVWPSGFSWRCSPGVGYGCAQQIPEAPQHFYDLHRQPLCGWEEDPGSVGNAGRGCAALPRPPPEVKVLSGSSDLRRFCPCKAPNTKDPYIENPMDSTSTLNAEVNVSGGYSCNIRMDDHISTIFYDGQDITHEGAGSHLWSSSKRVSFLPKPGAHLVVNGEDLQSDFYKQGGFWADCDFAPSEVLKNAWESFCSEDILDDEHIHGKGAGWTNPTFHTGKFWSPGTLGDRDMRYCAFRTVPMQTAGYRCDIKIDDYVRTVYYNGVDLTNTVAGDLNRWDALRRITFPPHPGAYLVIHGEDWKGDFYNMGGFWADCDTAPSSSLASTWESFCSSKEMDMEHRQGKGEGWRKPTFKANSHEGKEWAPGTLGDAGMAKCAFRMIPVQASHIEQQSNADVPPPAAVATTTTDVPISEEHAEVPPAPELPSGWKAIWDSSHGVYYYWNTRTNETSWDYNIPKQRAEEEHNSLKACKGKDDCLAIVDKFLSHQPRQANRLLRTYGPKSLNGGECGEECVLQEPCPTDPLLSGCRYDVYDNSVAAIYFSKRGNLDAARRILDSFSELLYPKSLDGIPEKVQYRVPSDRVLTLLAAAYSDAEKAEPGKYDSAGVYDGAVDTGNNAWAALAFAQFAAAAGKPCYADVARDILAALHSGKVCADQLQGIAGRHEPWPRNYRSTEHNIDVSALAQVLGDMETWTQTNNFVQQMFGRNSDFASSYSMGTGDDTVCDPTQPAGPVPADCVYWNILAGADPDGDRLAKALGFVLQMPQPVQPPDETGVTGPENDPAVQAQQGMWTSDEDLIHPTARPLWGTRFTTWGNGVQWEVTSSAAIAMLHFKKHHGPLTRDGMEVNLTDHVRKIQGSIRQLLGMYKGVPGSILGGNRDAWVKWTMVSDKWKRNVAYPGGSDTGVSWSYLRYPHVASTAWAGLLMLYQAGDDEAINEEANPLGTPSSGVPKSSGDYTCMGDASTSTLPRTTTTTTSITSTTTSVTSVTATSTSTSSTHTSTTHTSTTRTSTTRTSTTRTSTTKTTTLPAELFLWRAWKKLELHGEAMDQQDVTVGTDGVESDGITAHLIAIAVDEKFGLRLDEQSLTVLGVEAPEAEDSGFRLGDRLVSLGTKPLRNMESLVEELAALGGAQRQSLTVIVIRTDLCGHSCAEVVGLLGRPCSATWIDLCPGRSAPKSFTATSSLKLLCPAYCGGGRLSGAWTHLVYPGEETVLIRDDHIHWQSGKVTPIGLEIGTKNDYVSNFAGLRYHSKFFDENGTMSWSDGDVWIRAAGIKAESREVQKRVEVVEGIRPDVGEIGLKFEAEPPGLALVVDALPGSWAFKQGIRPGDEIKEVNGRTVSDMTSDEFESALRTERQIQIKVLKVGTHEPTLQQWQDWKAAHGSSEDEQAKAFRAWRAQTNIIEGGGDAPEFRQEELRYLNDMAMPVRSTLTGGPDFFLTEARLPENKFLVGKSFSSSGGTPQVASVSSSFSGGSVNAPTAMAVTLSEWGLFLLGAAMLFSFGALGVRMVLPRRMSSWRRVRSTAQHTGSSHLLVSQAFAPLRVAVETPRESASAGSRGFMSE